MPMSVIDQASKSVLSVPLNLCVGGACGAPLLQAATEKFKRGFS